MLLAVAGCLVAAVSPVSAQVPAALGPVPLDAAFLPASGNWQEMGPAARIADTVPGYPKTYWVEGGVVGGLATGAFFALVAGALCGDPDSGNVSCGPAVAGSFLVGGALGFTIGALIGGSVSKPSPGVEPAAPPGGTGRKVSGRFLGTAILVPTGVVFGMTTSQSLEGALVGGLAGFAAGQLLGTLVDRQGGANPAR